MRKTSEHTPALTEYQVWDRGTRIFHWVNLICVLALLALGLPLLFASNLGIPTEGKVLLKTVHVYVGYMFVVNLLWRIAWGFTGNRFARWRALLPGGPRYGSAIASYAFGLVSGRPVHYLGHNPIARLVVTAMLLTLLTMAITGLVLAGTDLYYPPFGHEIKEWAAGVADEDHSKLRDIQPGSKVGLDDDAYAAMRAFREPFEKTHVVAFYVLLLLVAIHVTGVVVTEVRERSGLISGMITGRKVFPERPVDADEPRQR